MRNGQIRRLYHHHLFLLFLSIWAATIEAFLKIYYKDGPNYFVSAGRNSRRKEYDILVHVSNRLFLIRVIDIRCKNI